MCREYGDVDDTGMEVDEECYDGSDSGYSSDGFWSGRLRDRRVAEQVGCRTVARVSGDLGECQYRDPGVKTFAWWQAALCQQERERVVVTPGCVLEEVGSDGEELAESGSRRRSCDDEDEMEWMGRYGGWKKRRTSVGESSFPDTEALLAQWLRGSEGKEG